MKKFTYRIRCPRCCTIKSEDHFQYKLRKGSKGRSDWCHECFAEAKGRRRQ